MEIRIKGGILSNWKTEDLESLVRYANNPKIAANLRDGFPHPYTREHGENWLKNQTGNPWFLAIELGGEAVGGIGMMRKEDVHRFTAEIGYWLAEPFWGKNIMSEAIDCFVRELFLRTDLERIEATPYSDNTASARVLEKAGFHLESIQKKAVYKLGEFKDLLVFVRFRESV